MTEETAGAQPSLRPALKVVDATLRDGGLVNDFRFSDDFVRALYAADLAAGVDYMEVGYKADRDIFDETKFGKWKFCRDEDVAAVLDGRASRMKLACMADVGRCNFRRDICAKGNSPIDMYRIATYADTIPEAIGMLEYCDRLGYETTVNIMAISRESDETVKRTLDMLGGSPAKAIYLVDSYGALYPDGVRALAETYLAAGQKYQKEIGIHAHNNQNLAFANTLTCYAAGANYLDATVSGMGRGAGNCALELLLAYLKGRFDLAPVLAFLEAGHMQRLKEAGAMWGYDLAYLVTGLYNRHPSAAIGYYKNARTDISAFLQEVSSS